ncbi:hypothetical protein WR25_19085 isoform C [Diploscapter pachys]|uniref:J domain-containing protein n=1 Tax=Diploscapter pachys TaxID=2018661 RepID=A0A2A2L0N1_9BILA|nr:hypothetical protein WR25_19085 isoform A [Diploscapter pachys]PAV79707.1 hypothetical protein WR25_19085 isoform B [Diploscapter pachys]PAV79708.1 hypothetical protein WR25_19085 isoform C [Diploscapter pachys]
MNASLPKDTVFDIFVTFHETKTHYEILEVKRTASQDEIRSAFVKKTKELHPDTAISKNTDSRIGWSRKSPTDEFVLVKEAYDILRDPEKRKQYDADNSDWDSPGFLKPVAREKSREQTIIDLNIERNESYMGPRKEQGYTGKHFSFGLPDYYAILGVSRTATQREIKSAYYKLSKKYHPDVTGNNKEAQAKFIQVTEAYETLKDPDRRNAYDNMSSGRQGSRYPGDNTFYQQTYTYHNRNPFHSKTYTEQEYQRIWEQFNRMKEERDKYDRTFRMNREKIWDEYQRRRATRWHEFHQKHPNSSEFERQTQEAFQEFFRGMNKGSSRQVFVRFLMLFFLKIQFSELQFSVQNIYGVLRDLRHRFYRSVPVIRTGTG